MVVIEPPSRAASLNAGMTIESLGGTGTFSMNRPVRTSGLMLILANALCYIFIRIIFLSSGHDQKIHLSRSLRHRYRQCGGRRAVTRSSAARGICEPGGRRREI